MITYVRTQGARVGLKGQRLEVRNKDGEAMGTVRLAELEQVVLYGYVEISSQAIRALLHQGAELTFLTYHGKFLGRLGGHTQRKGNLRYQQYRQFEDPAVALAFAKACIQGKLHNQRTLMLRYQRKLRLESVANALTLMRSMLERLDEVDNLETLRGMEGRASTAYFGVFGELLASTEFQFTQRIRRPPPDPVNILLSLGYTLLQNWVHGCVEMVQLDPYLGALHQQEYGRPSLVLDLMEEWRPVIVDTAVLKAIHEGVLRVQDFVSTESESPEEEKSNEELDDAAILWDTAVENGVGILTSSQQEQETTPSRKLALTEEGLRKWFQCFGRRMNKQVYSRTQGRELSFREMIREQVIQMARYVHGEQATYAPFLRN